MRTRNDLQTKDLQKPAHQTTKESSCTLIITTSPQMWNPFNSNFLSLRTWSESKTGRLNWVKVASPSSTWCPEFCGGTCALDFYNQHSILRGFVLTPPGLAVFVSLWKWKGKKQGGEQRRGQRWASEGHDLVSGDGPQRASLHTAGEKKDF